MINLLGLGRKTSGYGNRDNPTGSGNDNHKGLDLVLHNDNIPAVMGGTVTYVGYAGNAGNMVTIKSNDGYIHKYMHLASPSTLKVGQTVTEGQTIGIQGSTGRSTGKHLHFQVEYSDGSGTIDPEKYLTIPYDLTVRSFCISDGKDDNVTFVSLHILKILNEEWLFFVLDKELVKARIL